MHNLESVLENETHNLLWDFVKQTYPLLLARRSDLVIEKKKPTKKQQSTRWNVDSAVPADRWVKLKENDKRDKYEDLARELKITM